MSLFLVVKESIGMHPVSLALFPPEQRSQGKGPGNGVVRLEGKIKNPGCYFRFE